jgi:hypothetical protein
MHQLTRGDGKGTGRPSENGLYADAQAAYDYLLKTCRPQEIIVHRESLGTAVAVAVELRRPDGVRNAQGGQPLRQPFPRERWA